MGEACHNPTQQAARRGILRIVIYLSILIAISWELTCAPFFAAKRGLDHVRDSAKVPNVIGRWWCGGGARMGLWKSRGPTSVRFHSPGLRSLTLLHAYTLGSAWLGLAWVWTSEHTWLTVHLPCVFLCGGRAIVNISAFRVWGFGGLGVWGLGSQCGVLSHVDSVEVYLMHAARASVITRLSWLEL